MVLVYPKFNGKKSRTSGIIGDIVIGPLIVIGPSIVIPAILPLYVCSMYSDLDLPVIPIIWIFEHLSDKLFFGL